MSQRLSPILALLVLGALTIVPSTPASAQRVPTAVGDPIDNVEQRVSEHGFRFGADQFVPDTSSSYIVWQDLRGNSTQISGNHVWAKSLSSRDEGAVTTLSTAHANPRISGSWVVWTNRPGTDNDNIFARKLPSGAIKQVTTNPANQMDADIDGTVAVWEDYRNGNVDLYKKDVTTGSESPVVVASGNQTSPSISGNTIAWRDSRRGSTTADVYVKVGTGTPTRIAKTSGLAKSLSAFGVAVSGSRVLWNEVDPGVCGLQCEPRILKTCVLPCSSTVTVDQFVPLDPSDFGSIADLDVSGTRAEWTKVVSGFPGPSSVHVYTVDLASCDVPPCDTPVQVDTSTGGVIANGSGGGGQRRASLRTEVRLDPTRRCGQQRNRHLLAGPGDRQSTPASQLDQ